MPDLFLRDIKKDFPTRGEPLWVLRGVTLELNAGENVAILGPSGCGKSTLLHIAGTLDQPTSGAVEFQGQDVSQLAEPELARFRNHKIGFVFQDHHLLPQCSVLENVLLPTIADGSTRPDRAHRAQQLLERVELTERMHHRPAEISGGERQRAAIARALVQSPALLLADEPTGNLDRTTAATIGALLLELQKQEGFMMMVVTHSVDLAAKLSRRLELNEGRLVTVS
jgi:lipoprotein-releasing system ATP-binding protein